MSDEKKRQYVANLYSGSSWKRRVARMPMNQVTAIFLKHQTDGESPPHQEHLDLPARDPHHNEDDFPIY